MPIVEDSPEVPLACSRAETAGAVSAGAARTVTVIPARTAAVLASHGALDAYAALVPAALIMVSTRCGLTDAQAAWLLGMGPLFSGASQPFAAWVSDRFNSRIFIGWGLIVCAAGTCLIGLADGFATLVAIYIPTMIAAGAYHPVAAATAGQLGGQRRSLAASLFFVSGMIGGACGAYVFPRFLGGASGFAQLPWLMIPGILIAIGVHYAVARVPHRASISFTSRPGRREDLARWSMVAVLYLGSAVRFSVNMVLVLLFARWAELQVASVHPDWTQLQVANDAGPIVGNLVSSMMIGMGLGGVLAATVPAGREKWPLILVPIVLAPSIWLLPHLSSPMVYIASAVAGMGFASMVPVGMVVSQRLLPHHTSMASGLMLGGAWAISAIGPRIAQMGIAEWGIVPTFQATAVALAVSGLITLPLQSQLIRRSA